MAGKLTVITGCMFSGKCTKKGTNIIMYDGHIKKVEDIKVGEQLMGDDSTSRTVLSTTKGIGTLYKVIQSQGESYVVNDEHILSLKHISENYMNNTIDIPIKEFINESKSFQTCCKGYHVGVDFENKVIPLDPYILGIWIGAGISSVPDLITSCSEILSEWKNCIKNFGLKICHDKLYRYCATNDKTNSNDLLRILTELNVINNKHIPHIYLSNSRENRLQLLAGLIDTLGYWNNERYEYEITQKNKLLANQIIFLARSLGMIANIRSVDRIRMYKGKKCVGVYQRNYIYGSCLYEIPCRIAYKCAQPQISKNSLLEDISIQLDGEGEYFGFTLDGNGRFLLSDFTVTHNSSELQRQVKRMELAGKKCLILKHAKDTRYGKINECCTHDLKTMPALAVENLINVKTKCQDYDVIGIDEGQFFPDIVEFVNYLIENLHKIVIVAGLDGTFEGKPFGRIAELLPLSEQFTKLTAVCRRCGADASFTIRRPDFSGNKNVVEVVGAAELYESVCRKCRAEIESKST